ncbi:MAG: YdiU family protein [Phormidesmis sp. RL_2_1]|nr:YdiU family protein [Phormidesmis sp. RL_2_1]
MPVQNPFFTLRYESALALLGDDFYDAVQPTTFPQTRLRFRNNHLLPLLGLVPETVDDQHFIEAFGQFQQHPSQQHQSQQHQSQQHQSQQHQSQHHHKPLSQRQRTGLALRYHGHQFGQYNPSLGDGRGFLYGQVQAVDGHLLELGTKGSGQTPHSQGRDGRLSLLGGVREVLAAEALHGLGIPTSRVLSLIETGEALTRATEPSPTRSAVMVRLSHSHIRFGTFERLEYFDRPDLVRRLLDYVIAYHYGHLRKLPDRDIQFYAELVKRTAHLVAGWMAAGFCHGVLNTDNMSIIGEGFDYGPYAFIDTYNPYFTAASFDRLGRYSYRNQPNICRWNLEMLQRPLESVMSKTEMEDVLQSFTGIYERTYHQAMLHKLGFESLPSEDTITLIDLTLQFLFASQVKYHHFFQALRQQFSGLWREDPSHIFTDLSFLESVDHIAALQSWKDLYHQLLQQQPESEMAAVAQRLQQHNAKQVLSQSAIAEIWYAIEQADNWQPFLQAITKSNEPSWAAPAKGLTAGEWCQ